MSPEVLRRKLHEKAKHKPYRKCPKCGSRMECFLTLIKGVWRLFKCCGYLTEVRDGSDVCRVVAMPAKYGCGHYEELFRLGGGTGRHIPHSKEAGERE